MFNIDYYQYETLWPTLRHKIGHIASWAVTIFLLDVVCLYYVLCTYSPHNALLYNWHASCFVIIRLFPDNKRS